MNTQREQAKEFAELFRRLIAELRKKQQILSLAEDYAEEIEEIEEKIMPYLIDKEIFEGRISYFYTNIEKVKRKDVFEVRIGLIGEKYTEYKEFIERVSTYLEEYLVPLLKEVVPFQNIKVSLESENYVYMGTEKDYISLWLTKTYKKESKNKKI